MWMVFHVAKLDGIDLCFFPVMIWLITLLGSTCIMIWIWNSTTIDAYWEWNQVFQCKIEIRNVSCFVEKKKTEYKVSFSVWLSQGAIKKYQNSTKEMYSIIYSVERC